MAPMHGAVAAPPSPNQYKHVFDRFASLEKEGERYMSLDDFLGAVAPGEDFRKITREQFAILFHLADRGSKGYLTLSDFVIFEDLLKKPDVEYEIAFRLFDVTGNGKITFAQFRDTLNSYLPPDAIPFDYECDWLKLYLGKKKDSHEITYAEFAQLLKGLQSERLRQEFKYYDKNRSGYIDPDAFKKIILDIAKHKLSDSIIERLPTLCNLYSGSKISYANLTAFHNVIKSMDMVEKVVRKAIANSKDKKISKADFLDTAASTTRYTVFTPMEADIIFHFAGQGTPDSRLGLEDFAKLLDPRWETTEHHVQARESDARSTKGQGFLRDLLESAYAFTLGAIAGAVGATAVYPIDLVKTRMQNQRSKVVGEVLYKNSLDCFKKVLKNEGFMGLYSGLGPQLVGVAPEKAIKLTVNDLVRGKLKNKDTGEIQFWQEMVAGGAAGGSQVVFTNPLEIVKIRLQIQGEAAKNIDGAPRRSAIWIVRHLGIVGLYKGASACLLRDIPFSAIYFPAYAHLKKDVFHEGPQHKLTILELLTAGAIAGMPAAYFTTPADVIKTRLQVEARKGQTTYTGIGDAARKILAEEGITAFFKGGPARVFRSSPQFGVTLTVYELLHQVLPLPGHGGATSKSGQLQTVSDDVSFAHQLASGLKDTATQAIEEAGYTILEAQETAEIIDNAVNENAMSDDLSEKRSAKVTITFTVLGISRPACGERIKAHFKDRYGLGDNDFDLNVSTGQGVLTANRDVLRKDDVRQSLQRLGYQGVNIIVQSAGNTSANILKPGIDTVHIDIEGMTCSSCVSTIESHVTTLTGVLNCSINLIAANGIIEYDGGKIHPQDIVASIEEIGYGAQIRSHSFGGVQTDFQREHLDEPNQTLEARLQREAYIQLKLFLWSFAFAIPVFIISMIFMTFLSEASSIRQALEKSIVPGLAIEDLVLFVLATPVQFWLGWPFYRKAYRSLRYAHTANMETLVCIGTSVAYIASVASVVNAIAIGQHSTSGGTTSVDFFETSVYLITFIHLGKWLESMAKGRTARTVTELMKLQPDKALLCIQSSQQVHMESEQSQNSSEYDDLFLYEEKEVDSSLLQPGDIIKVLPGGKIPCDGAVINGMTTVDESMLTGEPIGVAKSPGENSRVFGGTINMSATIYVRCLYVGSNTTLAKIIRLVQDAQASPKAPIEILADKISGVFVPTVIALAVMIFVVWEVCGVFNAYPTAWRPFNERLASPTAVMVGTGVAARHGILVKGGGQALEMAKRITTVVFDKTGTLTTGKPSVQAIWTVDNDSKLISNIIFRVVQTSAHPLSQAIYRDLAPDDGKILGKEDGEAFEGASYVRLLHSKEIAGSGILSGVRLTDGKKISLPGIGDVCRFNVHIGSENWIKQQDQTSKMIIVAQISVADNLRPEAPSVIKHLTKSGIDCWMLTGDNSNTAEAVASRLGLSIDRVMANVKPGDKKDKVQHLQRSGVPETQRTAGKAKRAIADVGISVGTATDIAIEAADIVLIRNNLADLIVLNDLCRTIVRRIKLNFGWAFLYNILAIPIAAGILYPIAGVGLPPMLAGLAMVVSSVSVICSSLLLKFYRPPAATLRPNA
ncbi:hypothetical protein BZG36_05496, partial [Bifiguratus adelaidae]